MEISMIVAMDKNGVIGKENKLPWHMPADLAYFKHKTQGSIVIMGRKCFESIGRPLPNRLNCILSKNSNAGLCKYGASIIDLEKGIVEYFNDIDYMLDSISIPHYASGMEVFVIGGAQIYQEFMSRASTLYVTKIEHEFEGDTYFPEIGGDWKEVSVVRHSKDDKNPYDYAFHTYIK